LITVAGIVLIVRPSATVDQLLILTVPSGAEVSFDSQNLGHSPVKLESVRVGTHKLSVTKDGFQPIDKDVMVSVADPTLDFKLKPLPPTGAEDLPKDEQIQNYQQQAEEAFARGDYAIPYSGKSALYFADMILSLDENNAAGLDMRDRVRTALFQAAQSASSRSDLGQANDIITALRDYYPGDEAAKAVAARLESQLANHRGDVRDLINKAEDALKAGRVIEPSNGSAYYFVKQALALDRQNPKARAVRNEIRENLASTIESAVAHGDTEGASQQLDLGLRMFPEDKELSALRRELDLRPQPAVAKANDAAARRAAGLKNYEDQHYEEAIPDLEVAAEHDPQAVDVQFALGRSHYKLRQYDQAALHLRSIPESAGPPYRSALGVLGDIEAERGHATDAIEFYRRAKLLGGSTLYPTAELDEKIERLNAQQHAIAAVPVPMSIPVKHLHGGLLHGSCSGTLSVSHTGVRYDGPDTFSSSITGTEVAIKNDEITVRFLNKPEKFKVQHREQAEKFREALAKFQAYASDAR
jgi:tetratricopeptide (TPR) repeat protein